MNIKDFLPAYKKIFKNPSEDFLISFEEQPYFAIVGKICGFPDCCVNNFCLNISKKGNKKEFDSHPMCGTGYVPCDKCYEPSKNKEKFIAETINKNRILKEKFPESKLQESEAFFSFCLIELFKEEKIEQSDFFNLVKNYSDYPDFFFNINKMLSENQDLAIKNNLECQIEFIKNDEHFCFDFPILKILFNEKINKKKLSKLLQYEHYHNEFLDYVREKILEKSPNLEKQEDKLNETIDFLQDSIFKNTYLIKTPKKKPILTILKKF